MCQIKGEHKQIKSVDWRAYAALTMLNLNSHAQQYDGFTTDRRVFGRTPEMPTGTVPSPFYNDFRGPANSQVTQTHRVLAKMRGGSKILFGKRL